MRNKKIIHVDMDCFYAAVEVRDNPQLRGKPVAVGGLSDGRGVISAANYEARKFGVRSALATAVALRKCPQLQLVAPNMQKYAHESKKIQ
ncbi:MAG: DNA polymerase IV, partial [Leptospirales bacterium]